MKLRVFLSSPDDVADERGLARKVLANLPQEAQFRGRVLIEEVSWDNPAAPVPLAAQLTPQEAINQRRPRPAECDVVLVILWARMGTRLPSEYSKPDGSRFESGTEWEYLDAVGEAERRGNGTPLVLVYRRTERVLLNPEATDFADRLEQHGRVQRFFAGFRAPDGSLRRSYHEYAAPADFETVLERQTGNPVRRRVALADLKAIRPLVDRLVAARLLVTGQDGTVEVAHEAVLLHWKRLVAWVDEHRELILWQRRMEDDVAVWKQMPKDPGTLLRGPRLAEGERWLASGAALSEDEQRFVQASIAARDRVSSRPVCPRELRLSPRAGRFTDRPGVVRGCP